jgi:hypothetical protein
MKTEARRDPTIAAKLEKAATDSFQTVFLMQIEAGKTEEARELALSTADNFRQEGKEAEAEATIDWAKRQGVEFDETVE